MEKSIENIYDKIPHQFGKWIITIGIVGIGFILALAILELGLRICWRQELTSWQRI
jgi:hypothetical protein